MDKPVDAGGKQYATRKRVLREARRSSGRPRFDAWPVCPRCAEICDPRAFRCPSCGCRIYLD